jgi:hypothetical protein
MACCPISELPEDGRQSDLGFDGFLDLNVQHLAFSLTVIKKNGLRFGHGKAAHSYKDVGKARGEFWIAICALEENSSPLVACVLSETRSRQGPY